MNYTKNCGHSIIRIYKARCEMKSHDIECHITQMPEILKKYGDFICSVSSCHNDLSIHMDCDIVVNFNFGITRYWACGKQDGSSIQLWNIKKQEFELNKIQIGSE